MNNEAFSRVKIDAQLRDEGWDVQNPTAVRYEYLLPNGTRADYVLCDRNGRSLYREVAALPELLLEKLITRKLTSQGIIAPKTLPRKLAKHILSGSSDPFRYRGRTTPKDITLTFDETDADELTRAVDLFCEVQLPALISTTAEDLSKKALKDLKRNWPDEHKRQHSELSGFRRRLEETWGKPIGQLRLLLTIAREWCGEAHAASESAEIHAGTQLDKLMVRFLTRGCQVTAEIICLLENGFADGAMARWRTLHEIGVVAAVIAKHGIDIAERYLAHHAVESKKAMEKYLACYQRLGFKPVDARTRKKVDKAYNAALLLYGDQFKADYGWAAHHLKNKRPTFANLEAAAGYAEMRAPYQLGNENVHAGVKSMYVRLGLLTDYDALLPGPSNAGFTDPGQYAAHTLTQIAALVCSSSQMDDLVAGKLMQMLREEIPQSFDLADKRLRKRDRDVRASESHRS
jgi:hypothetical protein